MKLIFFVLSLATAACAQDVSRKPVRVSGGVMSGSIIRRVQPQIPPIARDQHISGAGVMHVIIGKDGIVRFVDYISGPEALRDAYVNAVRQWRYRPFMVDGQAVEVDTTVAINMSFGGR